MSDSFITLAISLRAVHGNWQNRQFKCMTLMRMSQRECATVANMKNMINHEEYTLQMCRSYICNNRWLRVVYLHARLWKGVVSFASTGWRGDSDCI